MLDACPHLPPPSPDLDWRSLNAYRTEARGGVFYLACLEYGHALWLRGLAARAILCVDRAFGVELSGGEPILRTWPLPYAATAWMMRRGSREAFVGNLRVHFQHYADRMNEPRREVRRWRAWGCWALTRSVLPDLPGDPRHAVEEPTLAAISDGLHRHGMPGEEEIWAAVLAEANASQTPENRLRVEASR